MMESGVATLRQKVQATWGLLLAEVFRMDAEALSWSLADMVVSGNFGLLHW